MFVVLGCRGAYPGPTEGTSAYLLQVAGKHILIDCGSGALAALQRYIPLSAVDAVVLSHLHADHACELPLLGYARAGKETVQVYAPVGPQAAFDGLNTPALHWHALEGHMQVQLFEGIRLETWATQHPYPGCMLRFETPQGTIAYSGDTRDVPQLAEVAAQSRLFVCDAALPHEKLGAAPHASARQAAMRALQAGAQTLLLTHPMPGVDRAALLAEAQAIFPATQNAVPGWRFTP
nr:MBL fold metallo-hydrolase [bacterium]